MKIFNLTSEKIVKNKVILDDIEKLSIFLDEGLDVFSKKINDVEFEVLLKDGENLKKLAKKKFDLIRENENLTNDINLMKKNLIF